MLQMRWLIHEDTIDVSYILAYMLCAGDDSPWSSFGRPPRQCESLQPFACLCLQHCPTTVYVCTTAPLKSLSAALDYYSLCLQHHSTTVFVCSTVPLHSLSAAVFLYSLCLHHCPTAVFVCSTVPLPDTVQSKEMGAIAHLPCCMLLRVQAVTYVLLNDHTAVCTAGCNLHADRIALQSIHHCS